MNVLGVIPARFASTRFPGKVIADIAGKPMIQRVWERARLARSLDRLLVATDDQRIAWTCQNAGIDFVMTEPSHPTGTDRLAEVARRIEADIYVNVQGDEPLISPAGIDRVVHRLTDPSRQVADVATAYFVGVTPEQEQSASTVHLVPTLDGHILSMSRLPIPFSFSGAFDRTVHIGLYAFRREALLRFAGRERGPVEAAESIELLRFLEHGDRVACIAVDTPSIGVDHPEDVAKVEAMIAQGSGDR